MAKPGPRLLYAISGSIAAVKAPEIVRSFVEKGFDVTCLMTNGAEKFTAPLPLATFTRKPVVSDTFGSAAHEMPHLKLAEQCDLMLVAPITATLLGRFAYGLSEDVVTLAYITTTKPVFVAPAMHPTMWNHPSTQENVRLLKSRGVSFLGPLKGLLADNSSGDGRMMEPADIVNAVINSL